MNKHFWQGKKVFVTGHTGFKGSWLSLWLTSMGAKVTGYALAPPEKDALFTIAQVENTLAQHIISDIRDEKAVERALESAQPDIIFHLAAQPLVLESYAFPVETYATNVMGTVHLLNSARQIKSVKAVVNVTTDKCYENQEWMWGYREIDRLGGHDPYSNSKACSELVTGAFRDSWFRAANIGLASARAGNVIGGGDWASHRLVPDIVQAVIAGKPALIRNPDAIRPWQHVLEPLSGYLLLAEKLFSAPQDFATAFNFGPSLDDVKPVNWIADFIVKCWGNNAAWQLQKIDQHHEAGRLMLDSARAACLLNWQPRWTLATALEQTVAWYAAWKDGQNMQQITLQQIKHYSVD